MKQILFLSFSALVLMSVFSCNRNTRYLYSEKPNSPDTAVFHYETAHSDYTLRPYDILQVDIRTYDADVDKYFRMTGNRNMNDQNRGSSLMSGYVVNDTGYIQLPVIGFFYVEGKTIHEVRKMVSDRVYDKYLHEAIVKVNLMNFRITFLGEVNNGVQYINEERIDILEAVALAGGIPSSGNMRNVIVLRETDTGKKMYRVDLTDRELLTTEQFYLFPGDMIIVEERPLKKFIADNLRDYMTILSIVTTTITTSLFLLSLK